MSRSLRSQIERRNRRKAIRDEKYRNSWTGQVKSFMDRHPYVTTVSQPITIHPAKEHSRTRYVMTVLLKITNKKTQEVNYYTETCFTDGRGLGSIDVKTREAYAGIMTSSWHIFNSKAYTYLKNLMAGATLPFRGASFSMPRSRIEKEVREGSFIRPLDHPKYYNEQGKECLEKPSGDDVWCDFLDYQINADNFSISLADPSEIADLRNTLKPM